jgi:DNA-binding transcriptional LysR family regulator
MHLRQLQQFITLAEQLNFHRAAKILNMAQPPLSVSLRKLESELGASLFTRNRSGVQLTAAGAAALPKARATLFQAQEMRRAVQRSVTGDEGTVRLGFVGSAIYELLPRLLPAFRESFPNIRLVLTESRTTDLLSAVATRAMDVAIIRIPFFAVYPLDMVPLAPDHLLVAVPRSSPYAGRDRITLAALRDAPFVAHSPEAVPNMHALTLMACQAAGFVPRIVEHAIQAQTILCLVESGLGVGLVPSVMRRLGSQQVDFLEIEGPGSDLHIGLGLLSHPESDNLAAQRFRDFAIAECAEAYPQPDTVMLSHTEKTILEAPLATP